MLFATHQAGGAPDSEGATAPQDAAPASLGAPEGQEAFARRATHRERFWSKGLMAMRFVRRVANGLRPHGQHSQTMLDTGYTLVASVSRMLHVLRLNGGNAELSQHRAHRRQQILTCHCLRAPRLARF